MNMVTLKQIAEEVGVTCTTVSNILNGKNKELWPSAQKRAKRVREIAARMNYRPHAAARAMRSQRTKQIGVLIRNAPDERYFFPEAYETILGINEALEAAGYTATIIRLGDVRNLDRMRAFSEHLCDGMIAVGAVPEDVVKRVEEEVAHRIWMESYIWKPTGCVRRDEVGAGMAAAKHAIEAGYRRILWFSPAPSEITPDFYSEDRFAGIWQTAQERDVPMERLELRNWYELPERLPISADWFTQDTCVIARDVGFAMRLAHVTANLKLRPGFEYGLISCEDNFQGRMSWPELCWVTNPRFEMGQKAAEMMLQMLQTGETLPSRRFGCELHRGSTAEGPKKEE
jgi:DNA-binding LacI/PurR family transcriptional regulator